MLAKSQLNLAHGIENRKIIRKNIFKKTKPRHYKETVRIIVRVGSPVGRSESTVGRICETSK